MKIKKKQQNLSKKQLSHQITFEELNTFDMDDSDSLLSEPGDTLRFFRFPLGRPFSLGAK